MNKKYCLPLILVFYKTCFCLASVEQETVAYFVYDLIINVIIFAITAHTSLAKRCAAIGSGFAPAKARSKAKPIRK